MGYPRSQWYVSACSREVQSGSPLRRVLLDTPVLLYRTEAGQPVALYDRCPHRGAPLSNGKQIGRSEEHTSELQSLMRISYAVFCLKKKNNNSPYRKHTNANRYKPN